MKRRRYHETRDREQVAGGGWSDAQRETPITADAIGPAIMVTLASLAVFAVTFWGWVVLGLPPAGADKLIITQAAAAVLAVPL